MTAVSIVGLICLVIFTLLLIIITIIVVRMRNKDGRLKQDKVLEEYRRVPLIPEGANNICCDSGNSSSKSCSCYTRSVLIIKDTKQNIKDFQCARCAPSTLVHLRKTFYKANKTPSGNFLQSKSKTFEIGGGHTPSFIYKDNFRYQGLSMNTFGKNCDKSDTDYIYPRSGDAMKILGIYHKLSVVVQNIDSNQPVSCLAVPIQS